MHIPTNFLQIFAWQGLKDMMEEKWLYEKGACGEACQILS